MTEHKRVGLNRMNWNGKEVERWMEFRDSKNRSSHVLVQGVEFIQAGSPIYIANFKNYAAVVFAYTTIHWNGYRGTEFIANVYNTIPNTLDDRVHVRQFRETTWNDAFLESAFFMTEN